MTSRDASAVVKETEPVPGMLLISPQAVMFEPTDYQSAPGPAADDEASAVTSAAAGDRDETAAAAEQHDCIIVPMDSISSIMISHHCEAVSTRLVGPPPPLRAAVTTTIRPRLDHRSTPIRLQFTALRPFDDLRYGHSPACL